MNHTPTLLRCWRKNRDSRPLTPEEIKRVAKALVTLQRGLTGSRTLAGARYMDEDGTLGAYLLYYYNITFAQISFALKSFLSRTNIPSRRTLRILDIGCGPAPAAMAFVDYLKKGPKEKQQISLTCIDASRKALLLARDIFSADRPDIAFQMHCQDLQSASFALHETYDVILVSHVINELWKNDSAGTQKRLRVLMTLKEKLDKNGILLICEPALTQVSRETIRLATGLAKSGLTIVSPCPRAFENAPQCPIFNTESSSTTCHAEVFTNFPGDVLKIAREAGLTRLSVKMTFFAFQNSAKQREKCGERPTVYRVVSDAMLNKAGRIRYLLCDGKRRIPMSAKAGDATARTIGFFNLKRYDAVTVSEPEIRGDAKNPSFGIGPGTRLGIDPFAPKSEPVAGPLLQARSRSRRQNQENRRRAKQR